MILTRRRRRAQDQQDQDPILAQARAQVDKELAQLRCRIDNLRIDNAAQRRYYMQQERELRAIHQVARKHLEQRRTTLLATTSLVPYTHSLQQQQVYRVPAPILTLQAKLCLHVHCICLHEELLLRTKEQGWQVITWMEAVEQKLATIRHEKVGVLWTTLNEWVVALQEIEEELQDSFDEEKAQVDSSPSAPSEKVDSSKLDTNTTTTDETQTISLIPDEAFHIWEKYQDEAVRIAAASQLKTDGSDDTTAEDILQDLPTEDTRDESYEVRNANLDKSFSDFLVKYQRRKELQAQQQEAELRRRDHTLGSPDNPYTPRRAGVASKLKLYASRLFQSESHMETSFHDFITSDDTADYETRASHAQRLLDESLGEFAATNFVMSGSGSDLEQQEQQQSPKYEANDDEQQQQQQQPPRRWVKGIQSVASKGKHLVLDRTSALHRSENNLDWPSLHTRIRTKLNNRRSNDDNGGSKDEHEHDDDDDDGEENQQHEGQENGHGNNDECGHEDSISDLKNLNEEGNGSDNVEDEKSDTLDDNPPSLGANEQRRWKRWVHKLNQSSRF